MLLTFSSFLVPFPISEPPFPLFLPKLPPSPTVVASPSPFLSPLNFLVAMAPKFAKGKGVAKGAETVEPPESVLSGDRTKSAFFFPSTVDVQELRASFRPLWGAKTGGREFGTPGGARHSCCLRRSCSKSVSLFRRLSFLWVMPPFLRFLL